MLNVVFLIIPEGCAFGSFELLNLHHYTDSIIESYEYQMLQGAEKTIKRYNPNLGICIYHNAFDMLQIPLLIHEMVPEYRMIVRQHNFHTSDTLVYAWIDD